MMRWQRLGTLQDNKAISGAKWITDGVGKLSSKFFNGFIDP
jgi:hypothetical protein